MTRPLTYFSGVPRGTRLLLALSLLTALGVGAWAFARPGGPVAPTEQVSQESVSAHDMRARNISLQPAALGLGRRLGRRFLSAGREVSVMTGTLTVGSDRRPVVVRRVQDEGGERVEVVIAGRTQDLTWEAGRGVLASGRPADAEEAMLAERIALDGPDQFVLAQLRGASYAVVARRVRSDEGGAESYAGPLHDVVRVGEPGRVEGAPPAWRLYYVNAATGLLDKVVSEEGGERVEAALSGWAEHAGEWQPSRVVWSRRGQVFMELAVTSAAHGPKQ
jgi:hypothetical protein